LNNRRCDFRRVLLPLICAAAVIVSACSTAPDTEPYQPSLELPRYDQPTFAEYRQVTRNWIARHRTFITGNHELETELNSPFELKPRKKTEHRRGILLVHGLGDSPGYLRDVGKALAAQGWRVRGILLPGHGSRPADTLLPEYEDWTGVVAHQAELLADEVDELWLGGFSTGGNLVTSYAIEHKNVAGLLLFSPGFYPNTKPLLALSPLASHLWDWVGVGTEDDILRYESLTTNASKLYYRSVQEVQKLIAEQGFDRPALITISADDSVLEPETTVEAFQASFTNPASKLIWYGKDALKGALYEPRTTSFNSYLPEQHISNFAHMSVMFAPDNPYNGEHGSHIMLDNGQSRSTPVPAERKDFWFSAWGLKENGKYHARLTWNPYFADMLQIIKSVTDDPSTGR